VDKTALLTRKLPEADVDIPDVGTIRVRALTRAEALYAQAGQDKHGVGEFEVRMLAAGLVDPQLSEDEVREWQTHAVAGDWEPITRKIGELSRMLADAGKEAYKSVRKRS
jgi:hypothetical protein